jgi:hypothetical protein
MLSKKSFEVSRSQTDGIQQDSASRCGADGGRDEPSPAALSAAAFALIRAAREGLRPSVTERARVAAILSVHMRASERTVASTDPDVADEEPLLLAAAAYAGSSS